MASAQEVRAALMGYNETQITGEAPEITEFAEQNTVYIFNVGPYKHTIMHPLVGRLVIPACEEGKEHSEPASVRGMVPYAVMTEMGETGRKGERRHDSGRLVALDLIGLGPYRSPSSDLTRWGVFIASQDTLDMSKSIQIQSGPNGQLNVPEWVRKGRLGTKPTKKELERANAALEKTDVALIREADDFWNKGPKEQENISVQHREALRRRKQQRPWDNPIQTLTPCPGCQTPIDPHVVVHTCGAVLNWERAIELGIRKDSDRPTKKTA